MGGLKTQSLNMSVWHNNTFGRNSFLGEVDLDLSEWDFSNTHINEYALKARVKASFLLHTVHDRSVWMMLTGPAESFRSQHKVQHLFLGSRRTAGDRWEWLSGSCRRRLTVSTCLLTLDPFHSWSWTAYLCLIASTGKRTSRMETGEVQIWVKDCKNLPPVRGVIIDPFVKW